MVDSTIVTNTGVSASVGPYVGLGDIGRCMTITITQAPTQAQPVDTRIGKLEFEQGVPTLPTVKNLYDQMDFQRACQLFLWAMPLVQVGNLEATLQGTT